MLNKFESVIALTVILVCLTGCSGGGSPVTPPETDSMVLLTDANPARGNFSRAMLGYWDISFNSETGEFEIIPLRDSLFHMNITSQLQTPMPNGIKLELNDFDPPNGLLDINIIVVHPLPNSDIRVFDMRGIFMGSGDIITSSEDPEVIYSSPDGFRLLNHDGYTRWWNSPEFTTPGLFGYTLGAIGYPFYPKTTINPYKYFSDPLQPDDPVIPGVNLTNRGTFSTTLDPPELGRRYQLQVPLVDGNPVWKLQYAIDVCWAPPTGNSPPPKPIYDFPPEANSPEAYHIEIDTSGSTAWYINDSQRGGDIHLSMEVFDWQAVLNPDGTDGEINSIVVESPTLFDSPIEVTVDSEPGSTWTSGIYNVTISDVHPTGTQDQEILITVRSSDPTSYISPIGWPAYPADAHLAAYQLVEIPIANQNPDEDSITVIYPNGGETWNIGFNELIEWSSTGEITNVDIKLSLDGGDTYTEQLADDVPNTGQFDIPQVGLWITNQARIKVESSSDSEVYDISDGDFYIEYSLNPVTVVSPNGGETWEVNDSETITWAASPAIDKVDIQLSLNSGAIYTVDIASGIENTGSYNWNPIPFSAIGEMNRIKITDSDNATNSDESDYDFTVYSSSDFINVTRPNGKEIWIPASSHLVEWQWGGEFTSVDIYLSTDGGANFDIPLLLNEENDGATIISPVPVELTDQARIRIQSSDNPSIYGDSAVDHSIVYNEDNALIVDPNGGEELEVGQPYEVLWSLHYINPNVKIVLSLDGGETFTIQVAYNPGGNPYTKNDGVYEWIPEELEATDQALLKIIGLEAYTDNSDDIFTINCDPFNPPGNIQATQGDSPYGITVSWDYLENYKYNLYMDDTETPLYTDIEEGSAFIGLSQIEVGEVYEFWVQAVSICGESELGGPVEGWICEMILTGPPENLTATDEMFENLIVLSWDLLPDALGYNIYRNPAIGPDDWSVPLVTGLSGPPYQDFDVEICSSYKYRVSANDSCYETALSPIEMGSTISDTPVPPSWITASEGDFPDKIVVEWEPVSGAIQYLIERLDEGVSEYIPDPIYEDFNVSPGVGFSYHVQAQTVCGWSAWSGSASGYTCLPADPPESVTASQGNYPLSVLMEWDSVDGATGYNIYRKKSADPDFVLYHENNPLNSWEDSDTIGCLHYDYQVSAIDICGEGLHSSAVAGWSDSEPAVTESIAASEGIYMDKIVISWAEVPGVNEYRIYRDEWSSPIFYLHEPENMEFEDNDPGPGIHLYSVQAVNECAPGPLKDPPAEGWLCDDPDKPLNLIVSQLEFCNEVHLSWDPVDDANSYNIHRDDELYFEGVQQSAWVDEDVEIFKNYVYRVAAVNDCGEGPVSTGFGGQAKGTLPPEELEASQGTYPDWVEITFNSFLECNIYRDFWDTPIAENVTSPWSDYIETPGETYYYRISTVGECGESELIDTPSSGWAYAENWFDLILCPDIVCEDSYDFLFDYGDFDYYADFVYLHVKFDTGPFNQIPWSDHYLWEGITPGSHQIEFKAEDEAGTFTDPVSCDFAVNSVPEVVNFNCPPGGVISEDYDWSWNMVDFDAPPYGDDVLTVDFLLDDGSSTISTALGEFATGHTMQVDDLVHNHTYTAWVEVTDTCSITVPSETCEFLYFDQTEPTVTLTNCPGDGDWTCEEDYMFTWDMDTSAPGIDPEDLYVRIKNFLNDEDWINLPQGTVSYTIDDYDYCVGYLTGWFEIQVANDPADWDVKFGSDYCEFNNPFNERPIVDLTVYPGSDCEYELGDSFIVEWVMSDDCTPEEELDVVLYLNAELIPVDPGSTSAEITLDKPGSNNLLIFVYDGCGAENDADYHITDLDFTMHQEADVDITNCPWYALDEDADYRFEWDHVGYFIYVKKDDGGWWELAINAHDYWWTNIPAGDHTFSVKVVDYCGLAEDIDTCDFTVE